MGALLWGPHPTDTGLLTQSVALWACVWTLVYYVTGALIARISRNFELHKKKYIFYDWGCRGVSTVFCFAALPLATHVLFFEREVQENHLHARTHSYTLLMTMAVGYFVWDTVFCILYTSLEFVLHGVICMLTLGMCLFSPEFPLPWMAAGTLMFEWSTIFLNARWILITFKQTDTSLFTFVNVSFAVMYMVCRIVWGHLFLIPYSWKTLASDEVAGLHVSIRVWMIAASTLSGALNTLWMWQLLQGIVAKYSGGKGGKGKDVLENTRDGQLQGGCGGDRSTPLAGERGQPDNQSQQTQQQSQQQSKDKKSR
uniref:TLC domain-containing protein n=1 Tax=Chromera velia CCMP2878 TaxID=1169474 RepID=A0A0G4G236_9ALVE|eukprot:Cvel_19748.t1-p1 / transcript=Cvel_19748.t1 / gene=Cvel_19748 / organism=Chromera_velia_CCMP2878 / gene_product=Uncharacterized TLC domain-containing protein, putative / transcript_product=Uncharacterized TLC domain-containing protein, putative / location=Cvel_scaffold1728:34980-37074(+) / protein_length=311 / sequence_SO=supercontig / SO=protein_coding / is_pseudo=false